MWCIEGYRDKELEEEIDLPRLGVEDVRRILDVQDNLPIEPYSFEIGRQDLFSALQKYGDRFAVFDGGLQYFLAYYLDE